MAFFPLEPATLGHTLDIPAQLIPDIWHVDQAVAEPLTIATLRISVASPSGSESRWAAFNSVECEPAPPTVPHVDLHLVQDAMRSDIRRRPAPEAAKHHARRRFRSRGF